MKMSTDHTAFFISMMDHIKRETAARPTITNMDVACILGRMIGMTVSRSGPDAEKVLEAAKENVVQAIKEFGN